MIRYYAGDRNATDGMRLDVFQKATTRCTRAGWLKSTDEWPYTGVTPEGLHVVGLSA